MIIAKLHKIMCKFYFCGSIRGGRQMAADYQKLIQWLSAYGQVLTEHVGSDRVIKDRDGALSDREIHDRDLGWISESDLVIAEVTVPSLGVGYEIARALQMGKPVWCLVQRDAEHTLSAMIGGCPDVTVIPYETPEDLTGPVKDFIS